jgi:hypothetical protein
MEWSENDEKAIISKAFAIALRQLDRQPHDANQDDQLLRGIAAGILELAAAGERDVQKLGRYAALRAEVFAACHMDDQFTPEMEALLNDDSVSSQQPPISAAPRT